MCFFFFKQKTSYEMRISDCSSDVCSSDLVVEVVRDAAGELTHGLHLLRLRELHLEALLLGHVDEVQHELRRRIRLAPQRAFALSQQIDRDGRGGASGDDRKGVVSGKSESVGVGLGGGGIIKNKKKT